MQKKYFVFLLLPLFFLGCKSEVPQVKAVNAYIQNVSINGIFVSSGGTGYNLPIDSVVFSIDFSEAIDKSKINPQHFYLNNGIDTSFVVLDDTASHKLTFKIKKRLEYYTQYSLYISEGENLGVNLIDSYQFSFITQLDSTPKFPEISDDSLLTLVQKQTFRYFWDYGHPVSGLARERSGSGETVTIGGSGFGVLATLVAIERSFITRQQGFERLSTIVNFLNTKADRFHGVFPHWMNGTSGKVQPFSEKDNGADLVETAFMMEGLLTVQQYFKNGNREEKNMCDTIQKMWEDVEWNWFQQNGQQKLYWHWSRVSQKDTFFFRLSS